MTVRTRVNRCSSCGYTFDAASEVGNADAPVYPKPGDASLCLKCGHIGIFTADGAIREPNDQELRELAGDARIVRFNNRWLRR
jgi:hypothetical protein